MTPSLFLGRYPSNGTVNNCVSRGFFLFNSMKTKNEERMIKQRDAANTGKKDERLRRRNRRRDKDRNGSSVAPKSAIFTARIDFHPFMPPFTDSRKCSCTNSEHPMLFFPVGTIHYTREELPHLRTTEKNGPCAKFYFLLLLLAASRVCFLFFFLFADVASQWEGV